VKDVERGLSYDGDRCPDGDVHKRPDTLRRRRITDEDLDASEGIDDTLEVLCREVRVEADVDARDTGFCGRNSPTNTDRLAMQPPQSAHSTHRIFLFSASCPTQIATSHKRAR
jgi:hypothetical protein